MFDYCSISSNSGILSPESSYSSLEQSVIPSNVEHPLSQVNYLSVININPNDLLVSYDSGKWLDWYKTHIGDLKNDIKPCRWIFMSNHPIPVGSILPIGSGYILPKGDRINVLIALDLKSKIIHSTFGVAGLRWTRDLIKLCAI